jgi:hypothetical protein
VLDGTAHSRIYLPRSASKRFIDKRFADAAVSARDQNRFVRNVHDRSPFEPQLGGSESLQFQNMKKQKLRSSVR